MQDNDCSVSKKDSQIENSASEAEIQNKENYDANITIPTLTELLEKITPDNLHKESYTGPAKGREIW